MVKSALLALHTARPGYVSRSQKQAPAQGDQQQDHNPRGCEQNQSPSQGLPGHSPTVSVTESAAVCNNVEGSQTTPRGEKGQLKHQESIPHHNEYDEEEWVSTDTSFGHKGTQNCNFTPLTPLWMEVLVTGYSESFYLIFFAILIGVLEFHRGREFQPMDAHSSDGLQRKTPETNMSSKCPKHAAV